MQKLPYKDFEWLDEDSFKRVDWENINTESDYGFILEVDLKYPKNLHESHSNFPLAPENVEITFDNLSNFSQEIIMKLENKRSYSDVKLIGTFLKRENYVVHFKNLKLYLQLGIKLTHVHRVLHFKQKAFIAPFIEKCTAFRTNAKTKFEQDQFKKVANCVYGKTIQNVRKYCKVKLHNSNKSLKNAITSNTFKNFYIIGENLVQTNHSLSKIVHDRPIYAGFAILELSKHFMFDFFYNVLQKKFQGQIDLGMSDTDSLLFKVDNGKKFWKSLKSHMDFSNYPTDHPFFSTENKSQLGFFKK